MTFTIDLVHLAWFTGGAILMAIGLFFVRRYELARKFGRFTRFMDRDW